MGGGAGGSDYRDSFEYHLYKRSQGWKLEDTVWVLLSALLGTGLVILLGSFKWYTILFQLLFNLNIKIIWKWFAGSRW